MESEKVQIAIPLLGRFGLVINFGVRNRLIVIKIVATGLLISWLVYYVANGQRSGMDMTYGVIAMSSSLLIQRISYFDAVAKVCVLDDAVSYQHTDKVAAFFVILYQIVLVGLACVLVVQTGRGLVLIFF